MTREQEWEGAINARDLGGLPAGSGRIQPGRLFRSARPDGLTDVGAQQLAAAGVSTIVDLRNDDERLEVRVFDTLDVHHHPIEDQGDQVFMAAWGDRLDSPAYYSEALRRWPAQITGVFARLADAPDGGILVHCKAGRDRTGLIVAMLLALVETPVADILDDYELAARTINAYYAENPEAGASPLSEAALESQCANACLELLAFLNSTDIAGYLTATGLTFEQLDRLRSRLLSARPL
ncbi:tyrosine phosphatase family protein [Kribbella amoyensis]|uniref:Tyrosine phosphatase family protein n=1 Tax=Kribbella amoyensis TaxID=996641 RepID=A0A561BMJ5_9ACTN|nr:tyrosine-protein phosphatase [Kribbella amoyensis]TWD80110.1 tyrosine phosphatase family protein [Kribbella amoyensis]